MLPAASAPGTALETGITQYRINEYAGACQQALVGLSGLRGSQLKTETAPTYRHRLHGYFVALHNAALKLRALRVLPPLHDNSPSNLRLWHLVASGSKRLSAQIASARLIWRGGTGRFVGTRLGVRLYEGLKTIEVVYDALRDARP
jgi:hypothetical protein